MKISNILQNLRNNLRFHFEPESTREKKKYIKENDFFMFGFTVENTK